MDTTLIDNERESLLLTNCYLQMVIPSVLAYDEKFNLRITLFGPDSMPLDVFDREIVFHGSHGIAGLPSSVKLSPADKGMLAVGDLKAVGPGHAFVCARIDGVPGEIFSNPAWVMQDPPFRIYWGDIHVHTKYSNCSPWACKDPEFCYAYARDCACLDFAAAADHLRGIASDRGRWDRLQRLAREYNVSGEFATFLAFESSHKTGFGGDINAYFLEDDAPYFWPDREDMKGVSPEVTLRELWDFLDATGKRYFTVPHHTGRAGKYRSFAEPVYDAKREPVFEIYSGWGSSEERWNRFPLSAGNSDQPCYYRDALRAGCRYGIIASSDCHSTLPGGEHVSSQPLGHKRLSNKIHKGLAALRAPELSRESLWQAFATKNTYASTFARVLIDFKVGEVNMGESAHVSSSDALWRKRDITVNVLSTENFPTDVVLVRNGDEIARKRWSIKDPLVTFEDAVPLDEIALRDAQFHPDPFVVYYVRVEERFDQTQWSSPVWLDLG